MAKRRGEARPAANRSGRVLSASSIDYRFRWARTAIVFVLIVAMAKLLWIQTVSKTDLSALAENQRQVHQVLPAMRGEIQDRNGRPFAFTRVSRSLSIQPREERLRAELAHRENPENPTYEALVDQIAAEMHEVLGDAVNVPHLKEIMLSDRGFDYLAKEVDLTKATAITDKFHQIGSQRVDLREYPGGALGANVVGVTKREDGQVIGLQGIELGFDERLSGREGKQSYEQSTDNAVIPGSLKKIAEPVDGASVQLTLDSDLQYFVQQQVQFAKDKSGAQGAWAVVLDAKTGEVRALANDNTFNPAVGVGEEIERGADLGNPGISSPFEPGSVNKIVTAAATLEEGLTTPDEVHSVPGSISMDNVTVSDAWQHGPAAYTTTGIFGKSSNVGTLMLAERLGKDPLDDYLHRFGLGKTTGIELNGESSGILPDRENWQGGTFANLPIGQGLSMTLLQMAGIYQTIANDGERIPPRIVSAIIEPDGTVINAERPEPIRVVSAETAQKTRNMFRAVVQSGLAGQSGTGPQAAIPGYQISGKTGTAQQIDPACLCYSNSAYWITFAGIAPADDPRFVIGIMLDAPRRGIDGSGGQSAAPLFHTIADWLITRDNLPPSANPGESLVLEAR